MELQLMDTVQNKTTTFTVFNLTTATVPHGFDLANILRPYILIYLALTGLMSLVGIIGNLLTITTFTVAKELQKTRNIFIVNLAVADFMVNSIVMPYSMFGVIAGKLYFDERPSLCRFLASICAPGCLASMYTICWISCSRYFYICKYNIYGIYFTPRNTACFLLSIWIVCFLIHLPNHVGWGDTKYSTGFQMCTLDMETLSYSFFYGCCMILAIVITFVFYFQIYKTIRKSNLAVKLITGHSKREASALPEVEEEHAHLEALIKDEIKMAKTSFKIFIIFVVTWTPTAILTLIGINSFVPHSIYLLSIFMAHSNSTLNFFVYYVDNEMFNGCLKKVGMRMLGKRQSLVSFLT